MRAVAIVVSVVVSLLLDLGQAVHRVVGRLVGDVREDPVHQRLVPLELVLDGVHRVVLVLETEGDVVELLVGVRAVRDLGDVVLVGDVLLQVVREVVRVVVVVGVVGEKERVSWVMVTESCRLVRSYKSSLTELNDLSFDSNNNKEANCYEIGN